mgnify:CR=1 FL=1
MAETNLNDGTSLVEMNFEDALRALEQVVRKLESGVAARPLPPEPALQNTPGLPEDPEARRLAIASGAAPSSVQHGCSGKHAAMLATCVLNDWPVRGYLAPDHPLQQVIRHTVEELADQQASAIGVDGCGAPLLSDPLPELADLFGDLVPTWETSAELRDAVIALAASSGGEAATQAIWGGRIGWLPWKRPGYTLGVELRDYVAANPQVDGVMLAGHGIICWADSAKACYDHTIQLIADAANYLNERLAKGAAFGGAAVAPAARAPTAPAAASPPALASTPTPSTSMPAPISGRSVRSRK